MAPSLDPLFLERGASAQVFRLPLPFSPYPLLSPLRQHPTAGTAQSGGPGGGGIQPSPILMLTPNLSMRHTPTETRSLSPHTLCPRGMPGPFLLTPAFLPTPGPAGSRWRDYSALAIIMAGIAFGFHQLYKVSCPPRTLLALPQAWGQQSACM